MMSAITENTSFKTNAPAVAGRADARSLNLLVVEDVPHDLDLLVAELAKAGIAVTTRRVDTAEDFVAAVAEHTWDAVISDYHVPGFGAPEALAALKNLKIDLPFIVVSSRIGEDAAVGLMKAGAHDFVMKSDMARLAPALQREMREATLRHEHRAAQIALGEMNRALQTAREQEQARIARELHDELGQMLTAIKLEVSMLGAKVGDAEAETLRKVSGICGCIDSAIDAVRRIAADLRPTMLEDLGLSAAVDWQLRKLRDITRAETVLVALPDDAALDAEIAFVAYRVVQECLTNIARHAQATKVRVVVSRVGDNLELTIADNGVGFALPVANSANGVREGLGLPGLRQRVAATGGTLQIDSAAGAGTTILARIPMAAAAVEFK